MASPAAIYAFDILGPDRFTELCNLLLTARYRGFLLGGVGADGGIDGEVGDVLGEWQPNSESPLLNEIVQPGRLVVFQFKHKTTARTGQAAARTQLLNLYRCRPAYVCELHRNLVVQKQPAGYVLVTNVEVNSEFRAAFIARCREENPAIEYYQVIGLDELDAWVALDPDFRHQFFPALYGPPRFNLKIRLDEGLAMYSFAAGVSLQGAIDLMQIVVMNVGAVTSYIAGFTFKGIVEGQTMSFSVLDFSPDAIRTLANPRPGAALEPGQQQIYHYRFGELRQISQRWPTVFLTEVVVHDQVGNMYSVPIPEHIRLKLSAQG